MHPHQYSRQMVSSQLGNHDKSRCFLHCQYEQRAATHNDNSHPHPTSHTCTQTYAHYQAMSFNIRKGLLMSLRVTEETGAILCHTQSPSPSPTRVPHIFNMYKYHQLKIRTGRHGDFCISTRSTPLSIPSV